MSYPSITLKVWEESNYKEVEEFTGVQPECSRCGGSGEYEGTYGPMGCQPCNSRLYFFIDYRGKRVGADDGDTIERHEDGLHLIVALPSDSASSPLSQTPNLCNADTLPHESHSEHSSE